MTTIIHKEAVVAHSAATIVNTAVNHLSISQSVDTASHDTSAKPSAMESLIKSALPGSGAKGGDAVNARGPDDPTQGGSDPGKGGGNSASDDYASTAAALRISLNAQFGDPAKDPTHPNAQDDLIRGGCPAEAALTAQLGLSGSANQPDPHHPAQATDPFDHTKRQSEVDALKSHQGPEESMVGGKGAFMSQDKCNVKDETGQKCENVKDKTYEDGPYHVVTVDNKDGSQTRYSKDQTTGHELLFQKFEDGSKTWTDYDPKTKETTVDTINNGHERIVTFDSSGKIISDSDHPKGKGTSIPDEEHQTSLPPGLANQINKELQDEIKSQNLPNHKGDSINVVDTDIPGTVSTADTKGVVIGSKDGLISNPGSVDLARDTGGSGPGLGSTSGNTINNLDQMSQGPGRDERGPPPDIKHDTPGAAATGGQHSNGNDQGSSSAKPVETVALHAVVQLQDPVDKHDGPHQGEPIKPAAEKLATAQIVQDAGHGAHQDAGSGFADLIRAAQNPAQFGLVATTQPAGPDAAATLHLANADVGGHGFGPHDGGHEVTATATAAVVHEDHSHAVVDQHHAVAAPVLDHVQVAHH
jgi:hypothetical protein